MMLCKNSFDDYFQIPENKKFKMEAPGIDPGTSRMLSERSTI